MLLNLKFLGLIIKLVKNKFLILKNQLKFKTFILKF